MDGLERLRLELVLVNVAIGDEGRKNTEESMKLVFIVFTNGGCLRLVSK